MTDLMLKGGRVIDPASGRDETADVAFGEGKVTEIGPGLPAGSGRSWTRAETSSRDTGLPERRIYWRR